MAEPIHQPPIDRDLDSNQRAGFILRCWMDGAGGVRARLIDVRTGVVHALAHLEDLPVLMRFLLHTALPEDAADTGRHARPRSRSVTRVATADGMRDPASGSPGHPVA